MIPTWLVQIGSMAGLFTFAFTVLTGCLPDGRSSRCHGRSMESAMFAAQSVDVRNSYKIYRHFPPPR
jgi:hypothetical protein